MKSWLFSVGYFYLNFKFVEVKNTCGLEQISSDDMEEIIK